MHDEFRPAADGSTEPALEYGRYEEVLRRNLPYIEDRPLTGDSVLADLGLDSLGTVRLLAELEEAFGRELPDEALDEATFATVDSLWQAFRDTAVPVA
ncbi:phosphopantetheine-binding protein [Streptomyces sp. NPDC002513]